MKYRSPAAVLLLNIILNTNICFCDESTSTGQCNAKNEDNCGSNDSIVQKYINTEPLHLSSDVLVYTVATEQTDGFQRYVDSAKEFNIIPKVLGFGEKWKGGQIQKQPGGGWKINLLKNELNNLKENENPIVLFTDGYDVIFLNDLNNILSKFLEMKANILFSAEPYCWPNVELASKYPDVDKGNRYLNSGMYIGYAADLHNLLKTQDIADTDDDQLFFTNAYLNEDLRTKFNMKLDHNSEMFQNINGAASELELVVEENKDAGPEGYKLKNVVSHSEPMVLHGNGLSKTTLNYLSNYLPNNWNSIDGSKASSENKLKLEEDNRSRWPLVYLALFVEINTPFLEEQMEKIYKLDYPKERMHLFVHNAVKFHSDHINNFITKHGAEYVSVKQIFPDDGSTEWQARDLSLDLCVSKECDIYFSVDSVAHLDNAQTLKSLIEQNRTVIAPMLSRPGKAWSNFWGALTKDGFYARSNDYMDIVYNQKRGLWNVPFVANTYIVNGTLLKKYNRPQINYNKLTMDPDMAFCSNLRDLDVFMYVTNIMDYGHLVNPESYDITLTEPDMYQIFDNEGDWEDRYIHPEYVETLNPKTKNQQPCPDVYRFPIVTKRFCDSLIHMMESFGQWSTGKHEDTRLEGGYEAVPTRDIHMNQVGWEPHWLQFLSKYVRPLQEHVFTGYIHDPPRALMNFVVRYRPDEQPKLRPHHDSSTYTINIALNTRGVDYEGGGCNFIRYNCSVVDTKPGWMLMHPGRLTHYHEGLLVTKGTRYIMISFVDP